MARPGERVFTFRLIRIIVRMALYLLMAGME